VNLDAQTLCRGVTLLKLSNGFRHMAKSAQVGAIKTIVFQSDSHVEHALVSEAAIAQPHVH
jgi:hypothetical protein